MLRLFRRHVRDMPLDSRRRSDELLVARREARAADAFAVFAERHAGGAMATRSIGSRLTAKIIQLMAIPDELLG
jgi:hypothetical protein